MLLQFRRATSYLPTSIFQLDLQPLSRQEVHTAVSNLVQSDTIHAIISQRICFVSAVTKLPQLSFTTVSSSNLNLHVHCVTLNICQISRLILNFSNPKILRCPLYSHICKCPTVPKVLFPFRKIPYAMPHFVIIGRSIGLVFSGKIIISLKF